MAKKVGSSHAVAYVAGDMASELGLNDGFYIVEGETEEDENGVKHETNPTFSTRVYPSADGEGWTYTEDDGEGGDE